MANPGLSGDSPMWNPGPIPAIDTCECGLAVVVVVVVDGPISGRASVCACVKYGCPSNVGRLLPNTLSRESGDLGGEGDADRDRLVPDGVGGESDNRRRLGCPRPSRVPILSGEV